MEADITPTVPPNSGGSTLAGQFRLVRGGGFREINSNHVVLERWEMSYAVGVPSRTMACCWALAGAGGRFC